MTKSIMGAADSTVAEDSSFKASGGPIPISGFTAWLSGTLFLIFVAASSFVWLNFKMDLVGLHGRQDVRIHILNRFSAYLMGQRYLPARFNALLIGNSVAAGYDTSAIRNYRTYNLALRAASMTEERSLTEQILFRGHIQMVILILHPNLTSPGYVNSGYITPHDTLASFGSVQTVTMDFQLLREALGHAGPISYDFFGRTHWPTRMVATPLEPFSKQDLAIDPAQLKDLHVLLGELHDRHVKVYALFAPIYQPKWDGQRQELLQWRSQVLQLFSPNDTFIRLPCEIEKDVQTRRENFPDYKHMSDAAYATVMQVIERNVDLTESVGSGNNDRHSRGK